MVRKYMRGPVKNEKFDIQAYMTHGVETIVAESLKATLKNPRESAFMVRFAAASKKASRRRAEAEKAYMKS